MNDSEAKVPRNKPGILKLIKVSQFNSWTRAVILISVLLIVVCTLGYGSSRLIDRLSRAKEISTYVEESYAEVSRGYTVQNKLQEGGHLWLLIKDNSSGQTRTVDVNPHTFMSKNKGDQVSFKFTRKELGLSGPEPENFNPWEIWSFVAAFIMVFVMNGITLFEDSSYDTRRKENRYNDTLKEEGYKTIPYFDEVNKKMKRYFFNIPLLVLTVMFALDGLITLAIWG